MTTIITKLFYEYYASDMGNYFDEVKDNEENIFNEIKHILFHSKLKDTIKFIIDTLKK